MTEYSKYHVLDGTGKPFTIINKALCEKQGIDEVTLNRIKETHQRRNTYVTKMEECDPREHKDIIELKTLAACVVECDYQLQDLWGFGRNKDYHRFWELPFCTCAASDNVDLLGTRYSVIDLDCIIHGDTYDF